MNEMRILVLLDGSERAEAVLPHVKQLAKAYDSTVVFVRVLEPCVVETSPFDAFPEVIAKIQAQRTEQIVEYLTAWEERFRGDGFDTEQRVITGPVVKSILELADGEDVDLIALASHGRTGLSRVFYGSIAAGILQGVTQPLLLVRSS